MRILYHHRTLGDGAEGIHVSSMVSALRDLGHTVTVSALIGSQTNVSTARTRFLEHVRRRAPRALYETLEIGYSVVGCQRLSQAIAGWKPDAVYERYTLFNYAGVWAARRGGLPLILEVNAPLAHERAAYEQLAFKRLARRSERDICARASLVVVVSTPLKDHLVAEGVPAGRILVLPNGVDPAIFRPDAGARVAIRARYGIPPHAVVIGFTGILRPWHGLDLFMEAAARIPRQPADTGPYLLIVGDGPSRADVERIAAERGLRDRLVVTGRVPHGEIPSHVAAFDIGVSPHATFYASPMKVPEYMATGVAVVAPKMPNLEDLIVDRVTGMLFEPGNTDALSAALGRLTTDAERRSALAVAGRSSILEGRTWRHNAAAVMQTFTEARACA
jgi:glycosyltransferase involved in cell wall biosynthesis